MIKYFKKFIRLVLRKCKNLLFYCYWMPDYLRFIMKGNRKCFNIFTHLTITERLLLYKLGISLSCNCTIVEIGSYIGGSSTFLASAAKEKMGGVLYCVDTWENEGMTEGMRDTYNEFIRNTKPYSKLIIPLRGKSVKIAKEFNKSIDLLFIDGDHSYEAVRADVEAWFPKLEDGAIVIFHDYGWAEGVQRVIEEIVRPIQVGQGNTFDNTYYTRIGSYNKK